MQSDTITVFGSVQTVHAAHTRLVVPWQAVVSYSSAEQVVHAAHTRSLASLQAVVWYSVSEQAVHKLHPEVMVPSELQIFPESARARVHCWLVCDGWCRGTVRGRGLLGGSAKARELRVTHACGAVRI